MKKVREFSTLIARAAMLICSINFFLSILTHESCQAATIPDLTTSSPQTSSKNYETPQAGVRKDEVS